MTREEAIDIIRDSYHTGTELEALEVLLPELQESDNEIHRKWILEYLYDGLRKSDEQFKRQFKSAIAWLEKQKEQKPSIKIDQWCATDEKPVDLEKELQAFLCNYDYEFEDDPVPFDIATHFYELGFNARKEE